MKQNIYNFSAKIIGCLLVLLIFITVIYGVNLSSKKKSMSSSPLGGGEEVGDTLTSAIRVDEICDFSESCVNDVELPVKDNKNATVSFNRTKNPDGSVAINLSIDGHAINLDGAYEVYEIGIIKSKYFVVSYRSDSKIMTYLDSQMREVKKIYNVPDDVEATSLEYTYYVCKQEDGVEGGMVKTNYKIKIDDRGTFTSNITGTEEGFCQ